MIPTVPFDLIFSVFVGLVFAACARVQFAGGGSPWGRELAAVLSFEAIIVWPVALYFYLVHPAWSWMYLIDPARLPWGVSVLVLLAYVATLLGGYLGRLGAGADAQGEGALRRARRHRRRARHLPHRRRAGASRTPARYDEYHAGHALTLGEGKLGWALAATATGVAIAIVLVGFTLWEQGKRSRSLMGA